MFNRRAEAERRERDTPAQIVHIARSKGCFNVSLRYRDDWLRARCQELKKMGFLRGGQREGRQIVYYPSDKWKGRANGKSHPAPAAGEIQAAERHRAN